MKIVIDGRMYGLEHAGIGRYVMNLVGEIEKQDQKNLYYLLLRKKYFKSLKFKNRNFKKVLANYPHYSFKEQLLLPLQLIKLKPDLAHFPHFNVPLLWWGRQVVTIHDLIKHQSKGSQTTTRLRPFYWFKFVMYQFLIWLAAKRACRVIVPSHFWQKELVKKYRLDLKKIEVTYEGVDEKFKKGSGGLDPNRILGKYKLKKPFVVYTGSLYPHKNVGNLVKGLLKIKNKSLSLVVVCSRSIFYDRFKTEIKKMGAEDRVNLAGFVPDDELSVLYENAEAFVFPTLMEGFGLPGLEAMMIDCPVLCSDIPVLKEIYGPAALYFDPRDPDDIAEKIEKIMKDKKLGEKLRGLGFKQLKQYSWEKMSKQTLEVYESCFSL